jgi:hypothetical protein
MDQAMLVVIMKKNLPLLLLMIVLTALAVSFYQPYDRPTWFLETVPVMIGVVLLLLTWRNFPLTLLLCCLLSLHALLLILGGHYTYARVPLGFWLQDLFDFSRNHYDRIGHIAQGFVPAILAREILLRRSPRLYGGHGGATAVEPMAQSPTIECRPRTQNEILSLIKLAPCASHFICAPGTLPLTGAAPDGRRYSRRHRQQRSVVGCDYSAF